MLKPSTDFQSFRLRPVSAGAERGASSMLRTARSAVVARSAPVLQAQRAPRQLAFDFFRAER